MSNGERENNTIDQLSISTVVTYEGPRCHFVWVRRTAFAECQSMRNV